MKGTTDAPQGLVEAVKKAIRERVRYLALPPFDFADDVDISCGLETLSCQDVQSLWLDLQQAAFEAIQVWWATQGGDRP